MNRDQRAYLRDLRLILGNAMRSADGVIKPLVMMYEQGYRWEPDEVTTAMVAKDKLEEVADEVAAAVEKFAKKFAKGKGKLQKLEGAELVGIGPAEAMLGGKLTAGERGRLVGGSEEFGSGAVGGMRRAAELLRDIEGREMRKLEEGWIDGTVPFARGHESYFLRRFLAAMRVLRLSWNKIFYASEHPNVKEIKLGKKDSKDWYGADSVAVAVRSSIGAKADRMAADKGAYVEVLLDSDEVVYIAQPPTTVMGAELEMARQRAGAKSRVGMSGAHRERKGAVEKYESNPHDVTKMVAHFADRDMFETLWEMDY